jgi:hypothetical protein
MNCRHRKAFLKNTFLDLGFTPLSNAYLSKEDLNHLEVYFPLQIKVCNQCWLAQTKDYVRTNKLFNRGKQFVTNVPILKIP